MSQTTPCTPSNSSTRLPHSFDPIMLFVESLRTKTSIYDECAIGYGNQRMWKAIRQMPELFDQVIFNPALL